MNTKFCMIVTALIGAVALVTCTRSPAASSRASPHGWCNVAITPTERAVCASPELLRMDKAVRARFAFLVEVAPDDTDAVRKLFDRQRRWLTIRDNCLGDVRCIRLAYQANLVGLREELRNLDPDAVFPEHK